MTEERLKWWRYAMMRFGRVPSCRQSSFAAKDAEPLAEDIQAVDEECTPAESASKEKAAKQSYIGLDYSRWEAWTPDDPATQEEAAAAAEAKRKAEDSAFEAANPEFCGQFLSDMRKRREKEEQKLEDSKRLRLKGNEAFKAKRLERALTLYFECLSLTPFDTAVLTNLAAVHAALEQHEAAIEFADRAIYISADNLKALFRRGTCLGKLGKLAAAQADLQAAVKLPGANAQVRHALLDATGAIQEESAAAAAQAALACTGGAAVTTAQSAGGEADETQPQKAPVVVVPLPVSPQQCLPAAAALASFVASGLPQGGATPATAQALQLLERASRSGKLDNTGPAAVLQAPLAWASSGTASAPARTAKSDSVVVSNIVAQSGALAAACNFLLSSVAAPADEAGEAALIACAGLLANAAQRSSAAASVLREHSVSSMLCDLLQPLANRTGEAACAGFSEQATRMRGGSRNTETAEAAVRDGAQLLKELEHPLVLAAAPSAPAAPAVAAAVELLLSLCRMARPERPDAIADDRFLRAATKDRTFIHGGLPALLMWSVAAVLTCPPPGLVATAKSGGAVPGISAKQATHKESCALQLLDACASLVQFLSLHSNTASAPQAVTDGAGEAWCKLAVTAAVAGGDFKVLSPVASLLQALASIIPRAVWSPDVLVHPAVQAASAALANLAHHPDLRPHFAAPLALATSEARDSSMALRPLLDVVRLPMASGEAWERVCAQCLAAVTNAATQCPEVAAAAHEAGAVNLLISGVCNTLGVPAPAGAQVQGKGGASALAAVDAPLGPLVLLRASMCLGRLRAMDRSGAIVADLRKAKHSTALAKCCDVLCSKLVFDKGGRLAVVSADKKSAASTMDALCLLLTAITTAAQKADRLQAAATHAALAAIVREGGLRSCVAWMVHSVSTAKATAQAALAGTVVSAAGGAADPAAVARIHVPPSAMRRALGAARLRSCGNIAKLVTNCAGAAAAGATGVVPHEVFDAVLMAGGVEALVEVVKADEDKGPVRQNASIALARLAKDVGCAARLRECGGMKVLMQLHSELGRK